MARLRWEKRPVKNAGRAKKRRICRDESALQFPYSATAFVGRTVLNPLPGRGDRHSWVRSIQEVRMSTAGAAGRADFGCPWAGLQTTMQKKGLEVRNRPRPLWADRMN